MMNGHAPVVESASGWNHLASQIVAGDATALSSLNLNLQPLLLQYRRQIGLPDGDDLFQRAVTEIYAQIRGGLLCDPERLAKCVWVMASHRLARAVRNRAPSPTLERGIPDCFVPSTSPEARAALSQQKEIAQRILYSLPDQHREVLTRFYHEGHSAEQIQTDLRISAAEFRRIKLTARTTYLELCQAELKVQNCSQTDIGLQT